MRAAVQHQREVGYVFAGSEPSLMERMLGPQAAVLQGRAGDAAREDSGRRVRRRSSTRGSRGRACGPRPGSAPRSSSSPATCPTTCSASRTKRGTKCRGAGEPARARDARRPAPRAEAAARRAADDVRGGVAAPDARAARRPARRRARGRKAGCLSADVRTRHPARRAIHGRRRRWRRWCARICITRDAMPLRGRRSRCCANGSRARRSNQRNPARDRPPEADCHAGSTCDRVDWNSACLERDDVFAAELARRPVCATASSTRWPNPEGKFAFGAQLSTRTAMGPENGGHLGVSFSWRFGQSKTGWGGTTGSTGLAPT